jgi:hypothetical protein
MKTEVPGENHRPVAGHWQTLSHNVVLSTPRLSGFELTTLVVIGTDCIDSHKSNWVYINMYILLCKKERKDQLYNNLTFGSKIIYVRNLSKFMRVHLSSLRMQNYIVNVQVYYLLYVNVNKTWRFTSTPWYTNKVYCDHVRTEHLYRTKWEMFDYIGN